MIIKVDYIDFPLRKRQVIASTQQQLGILKMRTLSYQKHGEENKYNLELQSVADLMMVHGGELVIGPYRHLDGLQPTHVQVHRDRQLLLLLLRLVAIVVVDMVIGRR